ncbi:hypothetical protein ACNPK2_17780, partial [Acinetobacter baumannii]
AGNLNPVKTWRWRSADAYIQTHIIDMPNYTLEDLEGIVET